MKNSKVSKALEELDYLEDIYDIYEAPDFVEIKGGQGGDVSRYRVYFKSNGEVDYTCIK